MHTFIDLFAGIGGFHLVSKQLGGTCVFASEWDNNARDVYEDNFNPELFKGDITLKDNQDCIPHNADILYAGFPCQPFSQAGLKKGFNEARGTLFFHIANIIRETQPRSFLLENVRHLLHHNNGNTFRVILRILAHELGYTIHYKIVKASDHGLPTHRPRVYIVGFRSQTDSFQFPTSIPLEFTLSDLFGGSCPKDIGYTIRVGGRRSGIKDRRNWDAYLVNGQIHYITVPEAKRMMGFPDTFIINQSDNIAFKLLGNSIAINPVKRIVTCMLDILT